ncbi:MAG: response regulator [Pseudomonadota bacterium]
MESLNQPKEALQNIEMLKVLIADDDPPTRVLLRAAISQWGYTVIEAKDGEEAWDLLQAADAPRLIILDWLMPKLDGIDLCRRLKLDNVFRPYIILLTQVAGTANIIKGLEAGADEFLSKPFNMAELRSRLSVGTRIIRFEIELAEQNRKLQNYAQTMEALAQERARQLVQHTDMLVMLGVLVLSISKEIREVITPLYETDPAKITEEEKTKAFDAIHRIRDLHISLGHIVEVIKSLQADSMQYPHKITTCKINDIINQVLSICQTTLKEVKVTTDLAADLPTLELDPEIIQQALVSLILNITDALKSQTNGTLKIVTQSADNKIQIIFEDSGERLTDGEVTTMFQSILNFDVPYQSINQKRLNIAMAKEILSKYDGKIMAENRKEGGVRFALELPLKNAMKGQGND